MPSPTIFTKIINGQIPCYKIYEDDLVFAFLDHKPNTLGHTLILPKTEVGNFYELPDNYYREIFETAKNISKALKLVTSATKIGLALHGFGVPDHAHVHLIPLHNFDDMDQGKAHFETEEKMLEMQNKILNGLQS